MLRNPADSDDGTPTLHQLVEEGSLDALRAALQAGAAIDATGHVGATALMAAIDLRDFEKTKLLIEHGADVELTDDFNATPLRHAVNADFVVAARLLLSLGVDRGLHPKYPLKKIDYDLSMFDMAPPESIQTFMSEAEWQRSLGNAQEMIREMGQSPRVEPMIADVQSVEMLQLFLEAGDDLNLAPNEVKRALCGLTTGGELRVERSDYLAGKSPRHGSHNPERMDFPFWMEMIRTGGGAYTARAQFDDTDPFTKPGAVWCYDRFGSSLTPLLDGRFVQIGGEHEDHYDPDFCIYNDVVVHQGDGGFQIYGYPVDAFPPTDFHTATLCGDCIYIIGCLGYSKQRQPALTPVYRLFLDTLRIESVKTVGEMPGWIHRHQARYEPGRNVVQVAGGMIEDVRENGGSVSSPNESRYELELDSFRWRRIN